MSSSARPWVDPITGADPSPLIDMAMAEVSPQVLLESEDAPMARTEEVLAAIQGPALRATLEARAEQIVKHGHDREYDSMLAIGQLPRVARGLILDALDLIDGTSERRNLPVARKRLARAAAVCLAAIDRLNMVKGADR